jgi:hypothetical protein
MAQKASSNWLQGHCSAISNRDTQRQAGCCSVSKVVHLCVVACDRVFWFPSTSRPSPHLNMRAFYSSPLGKSFVGRGFFTHVFIYLFICQNLSIDSTYLIESAGMTFYHSRDYRHHRLLKRDTVHTLLCL